MDVCIYVAREHGSLREALLKWSTKPPQNSAVDRLVGAEIGTTPKSQGQWHILSWELETKGLGHMYIHMYQNESSGSVADIYIGSTRLALTAVTASQKP
jgi:hypothetical protein